MPRHKLLTVRLISPRDVMYPLKAMNFPGKTFACLALVSFLLLASVDAVAAVTISGYQNESESKWTSDRCRWLLSADQFLKLPEPSKVDFTSTCFIVIRITGMIDAADAGTFTKIVAFLEQHPPGRSGKPQAVGAGSSSVFLDSEGGSIFAAVTIGKAIRASNWMRGSSSTMIPIPDKCYGACVVVLAASYQRMAAGTIGIHRPYFTGTEYLEWGYKDYQQAYDGVFAELSTLFRSWNISASLVDDMFAVPSNELRILTESELTRYRLSTEDLVLAEKANADTREICGSEAAAASGGNGAWWVSQDGQACLDKINAGSKARAISKVKKLCGDVDARAIQHGGSVSQSCADKFNAAQ